MKKFRIFCEFLMFLSVSAAEASADDLRSSRDAVSEQLKTEGGGLVALKSQCPQDVGNLWEYVTDAQIVPINASSHAVLVNSEMCGGGNKIGQYLIIVQNGRGNVITDAEVGDMSFLGKITYVKDGVLYLSGMRWLRYDAHCCP